MPTDDERRNLIRERNYLTDRLSEVSKELNRLSAESAELKLEMESATAPDPDRLKAIRRRRFYLGRYSDDLKAEREGAMIEHTKLSAELAGGSTATDSDEKQ
jgi:hypothetical protein